MSRHHRRLNARHVAAFAAFIKARDGYRCRKCGKAGRLEVDHVTPLELGGAPFDAANAQTLCAFPCHAAKTRAENRTAPPDPEREKWRAYLESRTG